MKSRVEKVRSGLQTDPIDTIKKILSILLQRVLITLEDIIFFMLNVPLKLLPVRIKAKLKHGLKPYIRLDYPKQKIILYATSDLSIRRARACEKEPETIKWIENFIQPGEVFYDVGANIGAYSLVANKSLNGNLKVYSFEPSYSTYSHLCENIIVNDCQDGVFPYLLALTNEIGTVRFKYQSTDAGSADHFMTTSSTINNTDQHVTGGYQQEMLGMTIDYLVTGFNFPIPTHLKIDVDGAELLVLQGAEDTLKQNCTKSILVEVRQSDGQADQVAGFLYELDYMLKEKHDRGDGIIWNYIFVKQ